MVRNILSGSHPFGRCLLIVLAAGLALGFSGYIAYFFLHPAKPSQSGEPVTTFPFSGLPDTGGSRRSYPIPPGVDTAHNPLEFRWETGPVASPGQAAHTRGWLSVSVDGLAVGKFPFDSLPLSCQRSGDGSKIGFLTQLDGTESSQFSLAWIDLSVPGKTNPTVILDRSDALYAFDPGWKNLAYTECNSSQDHCSLVLLDLVTRQVSGLPNAGDVKALQWSLDGGALGFTSQPPDGKPAMLGVLDLKTGDLVYHNLSDLPLLTQFAQSAKPGLITSSGDGLSPELCTSALQEVK